MRLLDLFCGAGGCAMGYYRAGFTEIVGIDNKFQKRYPFEFIRGDAIEFCREHGGWFDVIHASPPCQDYSPLKAVTGKSYPRLIDVTREAIKMYNKPYIIENVKGARLELDNPIMLCGSMFGLKVIRHRYFETNPVIWWPPAMCNHNTGGIPRAGRGLSPNGFISVAGHIGNTECAKAAMDIDWMTRNELSQAIPPAYTEWLGKKIIQDLSK